MAFDDDSTEQPPRLLSDEMPYCEIGTLMAFNWMRCAHAVTNPDLHLDLDLLRVQVHAALDHFLSHVAVCPNCKED